MQRVYTPPSLQGQGEIAWFLCRRAMENRGELHKLCSLPALSALLGVGTVKYHTVVYSISSG